MYPIDIQGQASEHCFKTNQIYIPLTIIALYKFLPGEPRVSLSMFGPRVKVTAH